MRVLLSTYDSRGGVEPLVGLAAAEGCDALVATGLMPAAASARSVAEKLGIRSVFASYCPIGLPPVDNVRDHALTDQPWLAADPTLAPWREPADLDVVQTGARILPDERVLPAELEAFLDAGTPPVYVGFGSMRAPKDVAWAGAPQVVIAQWADQPYWAGRVAALSIGAAHVGPTPTTGSLSAALTPPPTPETGALATDVAGTIRSDEATAAATLLLDRS